MAVHVLRRVGIGLVLLSVLFLASPAGANLPFVGQHYPNGAEDFVVGALPPPGFYVKNYFALIQKDRLYGTLPGVADDQRAPVDLEVDVNVLVPRFIWVSPMKILGASYGMHLFLPLYWADAESRALGIDSDDAGLGDIIFSPLILGWHFSPNFHVIFAEDVYLPTGDYQKDDVVSQLLSKNHWTFASVVAVTYLYKGFDFSGRFEYDFNTRNDEYAALGVEGDLDPGQEFHFDWALSYAHKEGLRYGLSGYAYWQTTKDEFESSATGKVKGEKGVLYAAGPTIKYWPNQGRFSAVLKHQWEFGAENLPEGQRTWLNLVWVF